VRGEFQRTGFSGGLDYIAGEQDIVAGDARSGWSARRELARSGGEKQGFDICVQGSGHPEGIFVCIRAEMAMNR
jgi:hypothetical protein